MDVQNVKIESEIRKLQLFVYFFDICQIPTSNVRNSRIFQPILMFFTPKFLQLRVLSFGIKILPETSRYRGLPGTKRTNISFFIQLFRYIANTEQRAYRKPSQRPLFPKKTRYAFNTTGDIPY